MAVPSPTPSKSDMRRHGREARRAFARGLAPEKRAALEDRLAALVLPHLAHARVIATYLPIPEEISPLPILNRLSDAQAAVLPWFADREAAMQFRVAGDVEPGAWGPQPLATAEALEPDALLVPLVLVDRAGIRIGQGGGHYDRALARLRAKGPVLTVGLAWEVQLTPLQLAPDPWDMPLDAVATPAEWIDCR